MSCAARPACAGASTWSSSPRPRPGDFIFVPPYVPHQEINASSDETLECVLVRSDNEAVVVNLDIEPVEKPEASTGWTRSTSILDRSHHPLFVDRVIANPSHT